MNFHQWSPSLHDIYGLPPMVLCTLTHFMASIPLVVRIQNYRVFHPREILGLHANFDTFFNANSYDSVKPRSNFFEPTYQPSKNGVWLKTCETLALISDAHEYDATSAYANIMYTCNSYHHAHHIIKHIINMSIFYKHSSACHMWFQSK